MQIANNVLKSFSNVLSEDQLQEVVATYSADGVKKAVQAIPQNAWFKRLDEGSQRLLTIYSWYCAYLAKVYEFPTELSRVGYWTYDAFISCSKFGEGFSERKADVCDLFSALFNVDDTEFLESVRKLFDCAYLLTNQKDDLVATPLGNRYRVKFPMAFKEAAIAMFDGPLFSNREHLCMAALLAVLWENDIVVWISPYQLEHLRTRNAKYTIDIIEDNLWHEGTQSELLSGTTAISTLSSLLLIAELDEVMVSTQPIYCKRNPGYVKLTSAHKCTELSVIVEKTDAGVNVVRNYPTVDAWFTWLLFNMTYTPEAMEMPAVTAKELRSRSFSKFTGPYGYVNNPFGFLCSYKDDTTCIGYVEKDELYFCCLNDYNSCVSSARIKPATVFDVAFGSNAVAVKTFNKLAETVEDCAVTISINMLTKLCVDKEFAAALEAYVRGDFK